MKISPVSQINPLIHYVRVAAVKPNFHTATPEICTVIRELSVSDGSSVAKLSDGV